MSVTAQMADAVRAALDGAALPHLRAVVLTGSLARDEGTWLWHNRRAQALGDAEFLVVADGTASSMRDEDLTGLARDIEARLHADGIDIQIGLALVRPAYLKRLRPHIFAYELLKHGKVFWGDTSILRLIPEFSPSAVPLEDGFRTLANRLVELLEAVCEADEPEALTDVCRYRAAKLWLDMATSFLLFQGQYESTYRERAAKLSAMASTTAAAPLDLSRFAEKVRLATQYKLGESQRSPTHTVTDLVAQIADVHSLWNWELAHLIGASVDAGDDKLLGAWLREQTPSERLRGWASLAKRYGLRASVKSVPRWITQALKGSPRRLTYAAASELFFALPTLLGAGREASAAHGWSQPRWPLPVMNESADARSWRRFGCAIAWNYHQFLVSTRS